MMRNIRSDDDGEIARRKISEATANSKAPGGRLMAEAITRQLEVAELVLAGIDEVLPR